MDSKFETETASEAVSEDDFDSDSGLAAAQYCLWLSKAGCKRSIVGRSLGGKVKSLLRRSLGVPKTAIVVRCIDVYDPNCGFTFLSGHAREPVERVIYAKHPIRSNVFVDIKHMAMSLYQEKFEEFSMVMRALGAKSMVMGATSDLSSLSGDTTFSQWVQANSTSCNFPLDREHPALPDTGPLVYYPTENEWKGTATRRLSRWIHRVACSVVFSWPAKMNATAVAKLIKLGIDISTTATRAVDIRQCFDIEFYGEQDYAAITEARIRKQWNLGEVLGFFHAAGGVEAPTFISYVKPELLSIPLTIENILNPGVFNDALLKKKLRIKSDEHSSTLLEIRDKLCAPSQRELRETIQEYAASAEARATINELCAAACASHTRDLARFIADPKDPWVKKYKAALSNGVESKDDENAVDRDLTITVVGDSGVGKTGLVARYAERNNSPSTTPSVGVVQKLKTADIGPLKAKLRVLDTAGREEFRDFTTTTFKDAHVVFIMYSVDSRESFERVRYWHQEMTEHGGPYLACALIGNKTDLLNREVTFLDGMAMAEEIGAMFFETSVSQGTHVDAVFVTTCAAALQQHAKSLIGELKFVRSLSQMSSFSDKAPPVVVPNGSPVQEDANPPPAGCCVIS